MHAERSCAGPLRPHRMFSATEPAKRRGSCDTRPIWGVGAGGQQNQGLLSPGLLATRETTSHRETAPFHPKTSPPPPKSTAPVPHPSQPPARKALPPPETPHLLPQPGQAEGADVGAVEEHAAGRGVVEALDEANHSALARAFLGGVLRLGGSGSWRVRGVEGAGGVEGVASGCAGGGSGGEPATQAAAASGCRGGGLPAAGGQPAAGTGAAASVNQPQAERCGLTALAHEGHRLSGGHPQVEV
jgi:hypothetical protein